MLLFFQDKEKNGKTENIFPLLLIETILEKETNGQ